MKMEQFIFSKRWCKLPRDNWKINDKVDGIDMVSPY